VNGLRPFGSVTAVPAVNSATAGRSLAVLAGLLVAVGSAQPWLGKLVRHASCWWSSYRAYRDLLPLWRDLAAVRPIAFDQMYPLRFRLKDGLTARGMHELLYRRVIEIRDGRLGIRHFLEASVEEKVLSQHKPDDDVDAIVEDALLTAAIHAARLNYRPTRPSTSVGVVGSNLMAEVAWLRRVARYYPSRVHADMCTTERMTA
jgi:hypothetical protein